MKTISAERQKRARFGRHGGGLLAGDQSADQVGADNSRIDPTPPRSESSGGAANAHLKQHDCHADERRKTRLKSTCDPESMQT